MVTVRSLSVMVASAVVSVCTLSGCGVAALGEGEAAALMDEGLLSVEVPGAVETTTDRSSGKVTRLFDVTGEWNRVSVTIAELAQADGWKIDKINCVGTGNDVIGLKKVGNGYRKLESGAGQRGAGIIVSEVGDRVITGGVVISGNCPQSLIDAVS